MSFMDESEGVKLGAQHKVERDGRMRDRIKSILLYDKGWSWVEIAEALLIREGAVGNHVAEFRVSQKLKPQNGGSDQKLSLSQEQELIRHLEDPIYLHVKEIIHYIQCRWEILYSVSGMTKWLHRKGFSYKKPSLVPGKVDAEK